MEHILGGVGPGSREGRQVAVCLLARLVAGVVSYVSWILFGRIRRGVEVTGIFLDIIVWACEFASF